MRSFTPLLPLQSGKSSCDFAKRVLKCCNTKTRTDVIDSIKKAVQHRLAREDQIEDLLTAGNEATPNFCAGILPILATRLAHSKNATERLELVESMCSLFEKSPQLAAGDPKTFGLLVGCLKDKVSEVRKAVLRFLQDFLLDHAETVKELFDTTQLVAALHERVDDKDSKCRSEGIAAVCSLYCSGGISLVDKKVSTLPLLWIAKPDPIIEQVLEKMAHLASSQQDPGLQAVAHTSLCKILQTYLDSMVVGDDEAIEQLGELPSAIFLSYKVKDAAYRAVVDLNVEKYLWSSTRSRADSWVAIHGLLGPMARRSLEELLKEKALVRRRLQTVLTQRLTVKGFVSEEQRAQFQSSIDDLLECGGFEDPAQVKPFFENLKDKTVLQKLQELCQPASHEVAREAGAQLLRHLASSPAGQVETMVKRLSSNIMTAVDTSGLVGLLHSPQQLAVPAQNAALTPLCRLSCTMVLTRIGCEAGDLLATIAAGDRSLFRPNFLVGMRDRLHEKPEDALALPLIRAILTVDRAVLNDDEDLHRCLEGYCSTGSRKVAKWATRAIAATPHGAAVPAPLHDEPTLAAPTTAIQLGLVLRLGLHSPL